MLEVQVNNATCDNCGLEYSGDYCPKCVLKCPYCNEILCEEAIDAYHVGSCPHLIFLYNSQTNYILWRNKDYENRFVLYYEEPGAESKNQEMNSMFSLHFDNNMDMINHFAFENKLMCIEHNVHNSPFHIGSQYLFVKMKESR